MSLDKPSKNEDEYFARRDAELLEKRRLEADAAAAAEERKSHFMKCPKCGYDLKAEDMHGIQIDRCTHCTGIWLDAGEIETLMRRDESGNLLGRVFRDIAATLKG